MSLKKTIDEAQELLDNLNAQYQNLGHAFGYVDDKHKADFWSRIEIASKQLDDLKMQQFTGIGMKAGEVVLMMAGRGIGKSQLHDKE